VDPDEGSRDPARLSLISEILGVPPPTPSHTTCLAYPSELDDEAVQARCPHDAHAADMPRRARTQREELSRLCERVTTDGQTAS
jgi:hypothetical protein